MMSIGLRDISPAQALVLSFLALIALGTVLLCLPVSRAQGHSIEPVQALFTATSAVCVTGLVVVDTGAAYSRVGQVFILVLFQLGGLGIMLFSTALFGVFGRRLGLKERVMVQQSSPGLSLSGVATLARQIVLFSLACELLGVLGLWLAWSGRLGDEAFFYALFHAVSAFCNAGFSLWSDSLMTDVAHPAVNVIVMLLIVVGGFGYLVNRDLFRFLRDRKEKLSLQSYVSVVTSLVLVILGTGLFWFFESGNPATLGSLSQGGQFWASAFQSITTRTAGFNSVDIGALREETLLLMMFLMFIGGCSGSTAGGIKTTTLAIVMLAAWSQIRGQDEVVLHERRLPSQRVFQALALVVVASAAVLAVSLVLNFLEPVGFHQVLFETVSAIATVGLSTGITASLSPASMILLSVVMFMGRVGPLTLAVSLVRQTRPQRADAIRYPKGELSIG